LQTTKGEPHDIEGKGTHIVPHSSNEIKIFNVLYVLILVTSLMSIGDLANTDNIMVFSNKYCWILNNMSGRNVIGHRDRSNGLYQFSPKVQAINIVEKVEKKMSPQAQLWHRRLGHICYKSLNHMLHQNCVINFYMLITRMLCVSIA
jgi:hypothetical protein